MGLALMESADPLMQNAREEPISVLGSILTVAMEILLGRPSPSILALDLLAPVLFPLLAILNYRQSLLPCNIGLPPARNCSP